MRSEPSKLIETAQTVADVSRSGVRRKPRPVYSERFRAPTTEDLVSKATFALRDQLGAESGEWSVFSDNDGKWTGEVIFRFESRPEVIIRAARDLTGAKCETMNSAQLSLISCILCFGE